MDRKSVVQKHNPRIDQVESLAPLSIGNSQFGFSVDFTGLQTYPEMYETPLGTQSNWGWHYSRGKHLYSENDIEYQTFDHYGREIPYPMKPGNKEEAYHWLRQNPHRLQLGQISFQFLAENEQLIDINEITNINQELDLWSGIITSRYEVDGEEVLVKTVCDPTSDAIGVYVSSTLLQTRRIQIIQSFPLPDVSHNTWAKATTLNWDHKERHQTVELDHNDDVVNIKRVMDEDSYYVRWGKNGASFIHLDTHQYQFVPPMNKTEYSFTVSFSPEKTTNVNSVADMMKASQQYWGDFWQKGAFVSFEGSTDLRANELERRVILSQYLTAVHSSGSIPPQETGLMYNSWFGKAHLEMHWWHSAHFPLWGKADKLNRSLQWYATILPIAKKIASRQGYLGARWPKMVGIDGEQSPSPVAPGLIWQQPHPIMLAELLYRDNNSLTILHQYKEVVFESADFMASFASWNEEEEVYVLGPPLIPAQECHRMEDSKNPPYEIEYWKYGLEKAVKWAERLGVAPNEKWLHVANHIKRPREEDGVYLAHENGDNTFSEKNHDHPSMVAALGILPGSLIKRETMKNTLFKVKEEWRWDTAWGWDFPMCAMTAARLGEAELAIDFLLMDAVKNTYLPNGHNYQRPGLTVYLPGNGGLLIAIAMMIAGWDGHANEEYPGFPKNGEWNIQAEGFQTYI
ncbi:glycoside hydrolase family 65 [Gracilibacillus salitolerans]|uniref:Glycoside hydrolase family 65 n=1 Tax=Gracilibacillus salitolerans TaxID=2663022 RepID=A0A5Q2TE16_9BACI|nr:glycoside hydrolase family 65 [Gracilibacillus salitolerans]QGH32984.1 glycoside hydrolase family 65 [Gracilibacillus salitolerans]